jgi:peptidyl-prolyl cis-trans isomerase D
MLDLMRRKTRLKAVLWLVIIGLALGMLLLFVPGGQMGDSGLGTSAATVDGQPIPLKDFWQTYRRVLDNYSAGGRNRLDPEMIKALGIGRLALDSLINAKVVDYEARRMGLTVTTEELSRAIEAYPGFQDRGAFIGVDRYRAILAANSLTVTEFENNVRNSLLGRKLQNVLSDSVEISDKDLRDEFTRQSQEAQVQFIVLKKDDFTKEVKPTEPELRAYFDKNKDKYIIKEQRKAQYLLISITDLAPAIKITEKDVLDAWDRQPHDETVDASHILFKVEDPAKDAEVRTRAEQVLKQVQAGGDFAELAKKYSEDTGSAQQGGNLGPFTRGRMVKEFENAAFSLKSGEVSGLVRTQFGYHIIKVLSREVPTLEANRKSIEASIQQERAGELAKAKAAEAARLTEGNKDLNVVAKSLGVPAQVLETGLMAKDSDPLAGGISRQMLDEIFQLKEINAIGKPVEHPMGQAIPKLIETRLPKPPDFAEARAAVAKDLIDARAGELMQAEAKMLSDEAVKAAGLEAAARKRGLTVQTSKPFKKTGASEPELASSQAVTSDAFSLPVGGISAPIPIDGGKRELVLQVMSRTPFDEAAFNKQKGELRNRLLTTLREAYFQDYIRQATEGLEKSGKIRINTRAVDQVTGSTS